MKTEVSPHSFPLAMVIIDEKIIFVVMSPEILELCVTIAQPILS